MVNVHASTWLLEVFCKVKHKRFEMFNYFYLDLLEQTLDLHPQIQTIHIGCDEVSPVNFHAKCREIEMEIPDRYIQYVKRVFVFL